MAIRVSTNRVDLDDKTLQKPVFKDYGETRIAENSGAAYTIDITRGNVYEVTLTANCTFTFSNPPASGTSGSFTLILKQDATGSRSVTWPAAAKWPNGTAPTLKTYKYSVSVLSFQTTNAGTTWWGFSSGTDLKSAEGPGLFSWGRNNYGQLGFGDVVNRSSPTQVGSLTTWVTASGSGDTTLAIKSDGTLWAWGYNSSGKLGLGDTANRSSPTQVGSLTTWTAVDGQLPIALKSDGTLWAWGFNGSGQLGLGDAASRSSPAQIGALTTWVSIASSGTHSFAIKSDGTLWSWGANNNGQLGLSDTVSRSSPVQMGALTTWVQVSCISSSSTIALKSDGTLWTWGYNGSGQLGLGNTTEINSPAQVGALTTWTSVGTRTTSNNHIHAIKSDGTLWGWGLNTSGQLGVGDATNRSSPVQIGSLTTWVAVSDGAAFSIALKSDGTIWTWGANTYGKLGVGDTTNRSSPVQVGTLATWTAVETGHGNGRAIN